jgi:hypothetical protein
MSVSVTVSSPYVGGPFLSTAKSALVSVLLFNPVNNTYTNVKRPTVEYKTYSSALSSLTFPELEQEGSFELGSFGSNCANGSYVPTAHALLVSKEYDYRTEKYEQELVVIDTDIQKHLDAMHKAADANAWDLANEHKLRVADLEHNLRPPIVRKLYKNRGSGNNLKTCLTCGPENYLDLNCKENAEL